MIRSSGHQELRRNVPAASKSSRVQEHRPAKARKAREVASETEGEQEMWRGRPETGGTGRVGERWRKSAAEKYTESNSDGEEERSRGRATERKRNA